MLGIILTLVPVFVATSLCQITSVRQQLYSKVVFGIKTFKNKIVFSICLFTFYTFYFFLLLHLSSIQSCQYLPHSTLHGVQNLPTTQTLLSLHFSHLYFNFLGIFPDLAYWLIRFNSVLGHIDFLYLLPAGTINNLIATLFAKSSKEVSNMNFVRKRQKNF